MSFDWAQGLRALTGRNQQMYLTFIINEAGSAMVLILLIKARCTTLKPKQEKQLKNECVFLPGN